MVIILAHVSPLRSICVAEVTTAETNGQSGYQRTSYSMRALRRFKHLFVLPSIEMESERESAQNHSEINVMSTKKLSMT